MWDIYRSHMKHMKPRLVWTQTMVTFHHILQLMTLTAIVGDRNNKHTLQHWFFSNPENQMQIFPSNSKRLFPQYVHFKQITLKLFLQTGDFFILQCTVRTKMTVPCYTVPDPGSLEDVYLQLSLPQHLLSLWLAVIVAHGCFCEKWKPFTIEICQLICHWLPFFRIQANWCILHFL